MKRKKQLKRKKQVKAEYVYCMSRSGRKGSHGRAVSLKICRLHSVTYKHLYERCFGCTKWIDQERR